MKVIGIKKDGIEYKKRKGSYVIIEREEDDKIAIATDKTGVYFFLGGGSEKGEFAKDTVKRELIEETGYTLKDINYFNKIKSWCFSEKYGYLDVEATIYIAKFDKKVLEPIEKDHKTIWVSPIDYKDKLYHEYQRYILNEYLLKREKNNV
ncbi:MAG: NUDIX domain-containing protein [Clostridia bacterium]|nr:NUDIX domain-containing protein [Clostridia bacterium]